MVKELIEVIKTFFSKNAFFNIKDGDGTAINVKYCQTIKTYSSDGTILVEIKDGGAQKEIDFKINGSVSVSLTLQNDVLTGLSAGNTVTLSATPLAWSKIWVYRNGIFQSQSSDWSRVGTTMTFTTSFGSVSGGAGTEQVELIYFR